MKTSHGGALRRLFSLGGAALLIGGLAVAAQPASAAVNTALWPTTWAYTDSRSPSTSYVDTNADAPIGSWRDANGKHHKSRSYFTYDVSALAGKQIVSAVTAYNETAANDCDRPRHWELWVTTDITPTTSWVNPPQQLSKVADIDGLTCPSSHIGVNLREAIANAVANHKTKITFLLRVPENAEGNLHLGRRIRHDVSISVRANTDPNLPTNLEVHGKPCGAYVTTLSPIVNAKVTDPDAGNVESQPITATFAIWPLNDPANRLEWTSPQTYAPDTVSFHVPSGYVQEGGSYAVAVRANDDHASSAWTPACPFTIDTIRPDRPPVVSSLDYRSDGAFHTGVGVPGQFTFSANGAADVVGFRYGFAGLTEYIAAESGSVTFPITPTRDGPNTLFVASVDRAGLRSDQVSYTFLVKATAPRIEDANRDAWLGDPHLLTFRPTMPDVVRYLYTLDEGPEQTTEANADGTAQVSLVPRPQGSTVYVRSVTVSGFVSGQTWLQMTVDTRPLVTVSVQDPPVGAPVQFTFAQKMHGVTEYVYQFNRGLADQQPAQTIAAGSASITFTPARVGFHTLHVFSRTASGETSAERVISFLPRSIAPEVFSDDYFEGEPAGGVGVTGTFLFVPADGNVVAYLYQFGAEPEQTAQADADGVAWIQWTPAASGYVQLVVRSRNSDGFVSDPRIYWVVVAE